MSKNEARAICAICIQPMMPKNGCTLSHLFINKKRYERIKAGDSLDYPSTFRGGSVCHDCGVGDGQYHHLGCDSERCPVCHDQLFLCDCVKQPTVPLAPICSTQHE
jgi:hypothetical protein